MHASRLSLDMVGYHAVNDDGEPLGSVDGVGSAGLRLHRMPGFPGEHGYVPAGAVAGVDADTNTVLIRGVTPAWAVLTPPPPEASRRSDDPWADRLGELGLFEPEGTGNEPFLHPDGG